MIGKFWKMRTGGWGWIGGGWVDGRRTGGREDRGRMGYGWAGEWTTCRIEADGWMTGRADKSGWGADRADEWQSEQTVRGLGFTSGRVAGPTGEANGRTWSKVRQTSGGVGGRGHSLGFTGGRARGFKRRLHLTPYFHSLALGLLASL